MSQTIRRGGKGVRRAAASVATASKVARAKQSTGSVLDRAIEALPFGPEGLHRLILAVIFAAAAMLAWTVASFAGVPDIAAARLARAAADAGFEVRRVEVRGVRRMSEFKVYERVLGERQRAMPQLDVAGLRAELLTLPWVDDARVSRQLPDTLVVDIVERVPRAVLRKGTGLVLIDGKGHELEAVAPDKVRNLLVVAGSGAGGRLDELERLLTTAPTLRKQVREAEWVGKRRWNLLFTTGQVLALPEGEQTAASALLAFARLDRRNRMIGSRITAIDMRVPDRIYLRVPGHARELSQQRADAAKAKAAAAARKE